MPQTHNLHFSVSELLPYVNWVYFFHAWGLPPRFSAVAHVHDCVACRQSWVGQFSDAKEQAQAREAAKLFDDAIDFFRKQADACSATARVGLYPAWSEGDDVVLLVEGNEEGDVAEKRIAFLRQQRVAKAGEPYLSLADFISPHRPAPLGKGGLDVKKLDVGNVLGIFVCSADTAATEKKTDGAGADADPYSNLLAQTLADRLAEAAAERMHEVVRRELWGYAAEERLSPDDLFCEKYDGRRPAVGYPSLPDQSIIFTLDDILHFREIGVSLTESGMMRPHASTAGLLFGHPAVRHFGVGPISEQQLTDYARRRGTDAERLRPFLARNLDRKFHIDS